jgi:hypothetical protein
MQESLALVASAIGQRRVEVIFGSDSASYTDGNRLWVPEGVPAVVPLWFSCGGESVAAAYGTSGGPPLGGRSLRGLGSQQGG